MIQYQVGSTLTDILLAKKLLVGLENYYPEFDYWYVNKCMPDILLGKNVLLLAKDKDDLIGVGIGKKDPEETKLRCIRVSPLYHNRGVGIHLIDKTLRLLDNDKPHATVPEEMMHGFSRPFINEFKFDLSHVSKGEYRRGKLEYHFNN